MTDGLVYLRRWKKAFQMPSTFSVLEFVELIEIEVDGAEAASAVTSNWHGLSMTEHWVKIQTYLDCLLWSLLLIRQFLRPFDISLVLPLRGPWCWLKGTFSQSHTVENHHRPIRRF